MSLTEFKGGTMENLLPINCRWGGAGGGGGHRNIARPHKGIRIILS